MTSPIGRGWGSRITVPGGGFGLPGSGRLSEDWGVLVPNAGFSGRQSPGLSSSPRGSGVWSSGPEVWVQPADDIGDLRAWNVTHRESEGMDYTMLHVRLWG